MNSRTLAPLALTLSLVACASSTVLTQIGPHHPPRDARCDFLAFAARPDGYLEIGSVDVEPKSWAPFERIEDFKQEIRPFVCKAGGDAVVVYVNGRGWYVKATILKREVTPASPAKQSTPAAAAAARALPSPSPSPQPAAGCQYDTQCKGERICVQGACVDPAPAAAAPAAPD